MVSAIGRRARSGEGPFDEHALGELRAQCRRLAATNEFAINGHENRISYIVGAGHSYRAAVCKGMEAPADVPMQVQKLLDEFLEENRWQARQQEIVRRVDRLNLPSYTGFVQPRLEAVLDESGHIVDVTVSYPQDLERQMLEYSGKIQATAPAVP